MRKALLWLLMLALLAPAGALAQASQAETTTLELPDFAGGEMAWLPDGGYVITGSVPMPYTGGERHFTARMMRLDADGQERWQVTSTEKQETWYANPTPLNGGSVAILQYKDDASDPTLTRQYLVYVKDGQVQKRNEITPEQDGGVWVQSALYPARDGVFLLCGQEGPDGQYVANLQRLDAKGDAQWQITLDVKSPALYGILPVPGGYLCYGSAVLAGGQEPQTEGALLLMVDEEGGLLWQHVIEGIYHKYVSAAVLTPEGELYVAGGHKPNPHDVPERPARTLHMRFSLEGEWLWEGEFFPGDALYGLYHLQTARQGVLSIDWDEDHPDLRRLVLLDGHGGISDSLDVRLQTSRTGYGLMPAGDHFVAVESSFLQEEKSTRYFLTKIDPAFASPM